LERTVIMTPEQKISCIPLQYTAGPPENRKQSQPPLGEDLAFVKNLGRMFFPSEYWQHLGDDEIFQLSKNETHSHGAELSPLGKEVRKKLWEWVPTDQHQDSKWLNIWVALTAGARISLAEECRRRLSARRYSKSPAQTNADWNLPKYSCS
jgi:hypothetical protein